MRDLARVGGFDAGEPYVAIEGVQTIFPVDGRATPKSPGDVIERYDVLDPYGRPWAALCERCFEQGMVRPDAEDIFSLG